MIKKTKAWFVKRRLINLLMEYSEQRSEGSFGGPPKFENREQAKAYVKFVISRTGQQSVDKWAIVAKHIEGAGPRSHVGVQYREPAAQASVERIDMAWIAKQDRIRNLHDGSI